MDAKGIYRNAIEDLSGKTHGKFEHDENKAIELFDKLLSKDVKIHCDEITEICRDMGYDLDASQEISQIYDHIDFYRRYKSGEFIMCWTDEMIESLCEQGV